MLCFLCPGSRSDCPCKNCAAFGLQLRWPSFAKPRRPRSRRSRRSRTWRRRRSSPPSPRQKKLKTSKMLVTLVLSKILLMVSRYLDFGLLIHPMVVFRVFQATGAEAILRKKYNVVILKVDIDKSSTTFKFWDHLADRVIWMQQVLTERCNMKLHASRLGLDLITSVVEDVSYIFEDVWSVTTHNTCETLPLCQAKRSDHSNKLANWFRSEGPYSNNWVQAFFCGDGWDEDLP